MQSNIRHSWTDRLAVGRDSLYARGSYTIDKWWELTVTYQGVEVTDRRQSFNGDDLVRGSEHDVWRTAHCHRRNELRHKLRLHYLQQQQQRHQQQT